MAQESLPPPEGGGKPASAGREGVTAARRIRIGVMRGAAATSPRTAFGSPNLPFRGGARDASNRLHPRSALT